MHATHVGRVVLLGAGGLLVKLPIEHWLPPISPIEFDARRLRAPATQSCVEVQLHLLIVRANLRQAAGDTATVGEPGRLGKWAAGRELSKLKKV